MRTDVLRSTAVLAFGIFLLVSARAEPPPADAQAVSAGSAPAWFNASPPRTEIVVGASGETEIAVWIDVPESQMSVARPPMSVSLVVDVSGSMAGEKILNARRAAIELMETLREGDLVSVYGFDTQVFEFVAPTVVNSASRARVVQAIGRMQPGGGTGLYAGLATGIARATPESSRWPVRRVFLISDGRANHGPSSAYELGVLAASGLERDVHVTGIGIGVDYDPETLGEIVVRSAGRIYHVGHAEELAEVVRQEAAALSQTIATDAYVEIVPAPGVVILGGMTPGGVIRNGRYHVPIGSLYTGRRVQLLLRARVPTSAPGSVVVGAARLSYRTPDATRAERSFERPIGIDVVTDATQAAESVVPRAFAIVTAHEAAAERDRALAALGRGDSSAAARDFDAAAVRIERAAAEIDDPATRRQMRERARGYRQSARSSSSATTGAARRDVAGSATQDAFRDSAY